MDITVSPSAVTLLALNGIREANVRLWTLDYLAELKLKAGDLKTIRIVAGKPTAAGTYGCFHLDERIVTVRCPLRFTEMDLKSTLIHELVHLKQVVNGERYKLPASDGEGSYENQVLFYASSESELQALAWEVSVNRSRYPLFKDAIRLRRQLGR